jgi:hypothetical protein
MNEAPEPTADHPFTAIMRGLVGAVVGFGIAAAIVVAGMAGPAAVAGLPGVLFGLVYLSWRPIGLALRPEASPASGSISVLIGAIVVDVLVVALAAVAAFQFVIAALSG